MPFRGGRGVRRLTVNAIKNVHIFLGTLQEFAAILYQTITNGAISLGFIFAPSFEEIPIFNWKKNHLRA